MGRGRHHWKPVGDLADTWDVSPDGLTWTFHLHPGVKWHDGEPFTANDVAFTVSRALLNTLRNPQNAWAAVVGVDKVHRPERDRIRRQGHRRQHDLAHDRRAERGLRQRPDRPVGVHRAPAHPQGHRPEGRRDDRVLDDQADRHRPVQVRQVRDRPVQPVRGEPGLLPGRPEDQEHLRQAAPGRPGDRPARIGRPRPVRPAQPGRAGPPREGADPRRALDVRRRDLRPVHEPADPDRREDPRGHRDGVDAQGIIDSIYGGAGHINRGVLPGMPPPTTRRSSTTTRSRPRSSSTSRRGTRASRSGSSSTSRSPAWSSGRRSCSRTSRPSASRSS